MTLGLINANPVVHAKKERIPRSEDPPRADDTLDPLDIYDILLFLNYYFLFVFLYIFFPVYSESLFL